MTHRLTGDGRVLSVDTLARVEGEGAMHVQVHGGEVTDVQLQIFEPPRFFEAFLRGRAYTEPPDITARICGICPVAYQMSACNAIEQACGVVVPEEIRQLRRLLYCGEWIESHALHVNQLLELIGGRAIHPVNVRIGGFYRLPTPAELREFRPVLEQALADSIATVQAVAGFETPDFEQPYTYLSLRREDGYPLESGSVVTSTGLAFPVERFDEHVAEQHVEHSHALHAWLRGSGPYVVGPLARYSLNHDVLTDVAKEAAAAAGLGDTCRNPFRSIVVRAVELVEACQVALQVVDTWQGAPFAAAPVEPRAGVGYGGTEAPRGLLIHRYRLAEDGTIEDAVIIPPTSQNQPSIEADLRGFVQDRLDLPDDELTRQCEQAIRNYDPCISCATHFLDLHVDRA
jgi:sulfhydrogenase subunit alpha